MKFYVLLTLLSAQVEVEEPDSLVSERTMFQRI